MTYRIVARSAVLLAVIFTWQSAFSAQQNIDTVALPSTFGGFRTDLNAKLTDIDENFDDLYANKVNGSITIYSQTTAPATCAVGSIWVDTDAPSGQRLYSCETTDTFVLQGGGTNAFPSGNDIDVDVEGEYSWDANGDWLRVYDGAVQRAIPSQEEIQVTIYKPNDLDDAQRDAFFVWSNNSGMSFVVTGWYAWSTSDNTDLNIEETDGNGANNATVDAVSITTDGTGIFYANDSTITAGTIENGHIIWIDFDDTDTPSLVHVTIYGYYNADVN